jgi:hypothetical protein
MRATARDRRVITANGGRAILAILLFGLASAARRGVAALLRSQGLRPGRKFAVVAAATAAAVVVSAPLAAAGVPGWAIQATANPSGTSASLLGAVSCPSATACMAVGYNMTPGHVYLAYAEFWDGTSWKIVPPVEPAAAVVSNLGGVSCTSATACTAVGSYETSSGTTNPLAERWNGTSWTLQSPQVPAGSTFAELTGVSCTSATACTAVGYSKNSITKTSQDLAEFWDGVTFGRLRPHWTIQPTQAAFGRIDYMLNAVSCGSATDCLAVGQYVSHFSPSDRYATWAEHWNGTSWSGVLPDVASSYYNNLLGVSCTSPTGCTAVGYYYDPGSSIPLPLAERWNGAGWTLQFPTSPLSSAGYGTVLIGVSCTSATACTAVGTADQAGPPSYPHVTLAESWDGTNWTLGSAPNPTLATQSSLAGVSCPSAGVCTAVGWWDSWTPSTTGFFPILTLAERHS